MAERNYGKWIEVFMNGNVIEVISKRELELIHECMDVIT